jgi:hypothetical protein
MPCGGIYPVKGSWVEPYCGQDERCFHCGQPIPSLDQMLWVEEWDAAIAKDHLNDFMATPEGQVIVKHGHAVAGS